GAVGEVVRFQRVRGAAAGVGGAEVLEQRWDLYVVDRGEHGQQVEGLEDKAHVVAAVSGAGAVGHGGEVLAVDHDLPAVERVEAGKAVEEGGLAGAGWADDGHHLAALDLEVDAAQGFDLVVAPVT